VVSKPQNCAALLLVLISAAGCVLNDEPLSDEKTSTIDERLIGTWRVTTIDSTEKRSELTMVIARKADVAKALEVTFDNGKEKATTDLFATTIGNEHFVSFKPVLGKEKDPEKLPYFLILKYDVGDDGSMPVHLLDLKFFLDAVRRNELTGDKDNGNIVLAVLLHENPETIRKFIEQGGEKCMAKDLPTRVEIVREK
jgi:hypothetical protein